VAVNVDPDVLVIDEVLAVGDERFQRKCIERVKQFQKEGRTILFVSHSADLVRSICDRAVVLSDGVVVGGGPPGEAVRIFRERLLEAGDVLALGETAPPAPEPAPGTPSPAAAPAPPVPDGIAAHPTDESRPVRLRDVRVVRAPGDDRPYIVPGESLTVRVDYEASSAVHDTVFHLEIRGDEELMFFRTDTAILGQSIDLPAGRGSMDFVLDGIPMSDGAYDVSIGIQTPRGMSDWREPSCRFEVMNPGRSGGVVSIPVQAVVGGDGS
jgi:ABC-2 type transport system ATP-binding protein